MDEPTSAVNPTGYKDRRAGLIVFGILLIVLGCACILFAGLMLSMKAMITAGVAGSNPHAVTTPGTENSIVPVVVICVGLAAVFIWLGIGSILCRRWARPLVLTLSWVWLATGVISMVAAAVVMPRAMAGAMPATDTPMPAGAVTAIVFGMLGFLAVFLVILPAVLILFYRSRHVKATCEARDPVARWTDACPPTVLGLSLALALGTVFVPFELLLTPPAFPCFGLLLTGAPAAAALLAMAAVWAYCAWATYKMQPAGWWATVIVFAVSSVSGLVTFLRVDFIEILRRTGTPEAQIAQFQQMMFFGNRDLVLWMAVTSALMFGYLLSVKKHFRPHDKPADA